MVINNVTMMVMTTTTMMMVMYMNCVEAAHCSRFGFVSIHMTA